MASRQQAARRGGVLWAVAALLLYVALSIALFANVWSSPATRWIGVAGDPENTIWTIQWVAFAATHNRNPFLTDFVFYPATTDLLWSNADAPFALAAGVFPVTVLFGPVVAYNVLQTLALALSAWTASLAIRRFVALAPTAIVGGLVYGFGPYVWGQAYGHMALTFGVVPPLLFILLDRLLVRREGSAIVIGVAAGLLQAFQLLTTEEFVVTYLVIAGVGIAWLAAIAILLRWSVPWALVARRAALAAGAAVVTFAAVDAYPLYLLFFGPSRVTHGFIRPFGEFVTDLYNVVIPPAQTHLLSNEWTARISAVFPGAPVESGAYLGVGLLAILFVTALLWIRHPIVLFCTLMVISALVLSMGPRLVYGGHTSHNIRLPWIVMRDVPVVNQLLVERLAWFADLFGGFLLAVFLDRTLRGSWRPGRALGVISTAAALAFLVPSLPWAASTVQLPALFQPGTPANAAFRSSVPDGSVVIVLPSNLQVDGAYATLWQPLAGFTFRRFDGDFVRGLPDGTGSLYPAPSPLWSAVSALQGGAQPSTSPADLAQVRDQLAALGVKAVVVGPMPGQDAAIEYFTLLLGRGPQSTGGTFVWTTG